MCGQCRALKVSVHPATEVISKSIHKTVEAFRVQGQTLDEVEVLRPYLGTKFLDTKDAVRAIELRKALQYRGAFTYCLLAGAENLGRYCTGRFVSEHRSEMVTNEEILHHGGSIYMEHLVNLNSDLTREAEEGECYGPRTEGSRRKQIRYYSAAVGSMSLVKHTDVLDLCMSFR
jgi:hypothetical protein